MNSMTIVLLVLTFGALFASPGGKGLSNFAVVALIFLWVVLVLGLAALATWTWWVAR
jgi:hypothetical protein